MLAFGIALDGPALRDFYLDRWPVEQLPLSAKQRIGAARQFVFANQSRQRLPELSLLAGNILSYAAATQKPVATGFWDRKPRPTSGRFRRALAQAHFSELPALPEQIRKKNSPTDHLPKGILGHRRQKAAAESQIQMQTLQKAA